MKLVALLISKMIMMIVIMMVIIAMIAPIQVREVIVQYGILLQFT